MNCTHLMRDFLNDEAGFLISAELVLISTTVVLGLVTGLVCVRNAVVAEMTDVSQALNSLNQSYSYSGMHACKTFFCGTKSYTAGSCFYDRVDGGEQIQTDFDIPCCPATPLPPTMGPPAVVPTPIPGPCVIPAPQPVPGPIVDCPPVFHSAPAPVLPPVPACPPVNQLPPCEVPAADCPAVNCPAPASVPASSMNCCPAPASATPTPTVW